MKNIIEYIHFRKREEKKPFAAHLYDMKALRDHVSERIKTIPEKCRLFYAIKANSDPRILMELAPLVHGFETASLGEIRKVRAVAPHIPILFGGPGKTDEEIEGAIEHKVSLLHVESLDELQRVEWIAGNKGAVVPILLRVNLRGPLPTATLAMGGRPTQFGIDENEIPDMIRLALECKHVKLEGFHFHSLSNNLDAVRHVELVEYYCKRTTQWAEEFGLKISYLNAGGGIGVNYADLEQQFDWHSFIYHLRLMLEARCPEDTTILFECGRYMTSSCGYYAAQVLDIKQNHGKNYAIIRGGTHHFRLPVSWQHSHPFEVIPVERWDYPFKRKELHDSSITIVGQLCTPKDVLAQEIPVSRIRTGDVILFKYTGAYGWAISHHDFLSHPYPEHIYLK